MSKKYGTSEITPSTQYQYDTLDEAAHEIRVLTILHGLFNSEVRILLETVPFTKDSGLEFEALSYTWGSAEHPRAVFVGGIGHETVLVTQNLAEALPYLRDETVQRRFWIDAICVNQQDLAERGSQVKRMADIYSSATRVVIWIGPASSNSSKAMGLLDSLGSKIDVNYLDGPMKPSAESGSMDEPWADRTIPLPWTQIDLLAIHDMLMRPWFGRLWIWQEVSLASPAAMLLCGTRSMLWDRFRTAVYAMKVKGFAPASVGLSFDTDLRRRLYLVFRLCDGRNGQLVHILNNARDSQCFDPRDRIYALLSLLSRRELEIEPNYTKTVFEVYRDAILHYIRGALHILNTIEMSIEGSLKPEERWTSWVPDWSRPRQANPLPTPNAASFSIAKSALVEGDVLQIHGILVAEVEETWPLTAQDVERRGDPLTWDDYINIAIELKNVFLKIYPTGSEHLEEREAFCQVVCPGIFAERYHPLDPDNLPIAEAEQALLKLVVTSDANVTAATIHVLFTSYVAHYTEGRSVVRTSDGHLGLVPKAAAKGDKLAVILGCQSVMVLRTAGLAQFRIVGEAYCNGFMDGEALLGPLPESTRVVIRYDPMTGARQWAYLDSKTGKLSIDDPRLMSVNLPIGWRTKSHDEDGIWNWFVNDDTGKEHKYSVDPRLTAECFRERGLEVRALDII